MSSVVVVSALRGGNLVWMSCVVDGGKFKTSRPDVEVNPECPVLQDLTCHHSDCMAEMGPNYTAADAWLTLGNASHCSDPTELSMATGVDIAVCDRDHS